MCFIYRRAPGWDSYKGIYLSKFKLNIECRSLFAIYSIYYDIRCCLSGRIQKLFNDDRCKFFLGQVDNRIISKMMMIDVAPAADMRV